MWKRTIDIKAVMKDESLSDREAGMKIVNLLKADPYFGDTYFPDELEDYIEDGNVEMFDYVLAQVYDEADAQRIWLGL